jgi:hypothetical protein
MKFSKLKVLSVTVCAVALIGSVAFARAVHNHNVSVSVERAFGPNAVFGPDGKFVGVAADPNTRAEMKALLDLN